MNIAAVSTTLTPSCSLLQIQIITIRNKSANVINIPPAIYNHFAQSSAKLVGKSRANSTPAASSINKIPIPTNITSIMNKDV